MGPIQPSAAAGFLPLLRADAGQPSKIPSFGAGTAAPTGGQRSTASSQLDTIANVLARVGELLDSFGSELSGDQQLRAIIALLIISILLAEDSAGSTSGVKDLMNLLTGNGAANQPTYYASVSTTNIVMIQQQSTLIVNNYAGNPFNAPTGGADAPGLNLDALA